MRGNKYTIKQLLQFPFESILNIGVYDFDAIRKTCDPFFTLVKSNEFYQTERPMKYTLEFILTNLSLWKEEFPEDVLINLLQLLKEILTSLRVHRSVNNLIKIDKERILEILKKCLTEVKTVSNSQGELYKIIIYDLISFTTIKYLNQNSHKNITNIFGFLQNNFEADFNLAQIAWCIITKFPVPTGPFVDCATWLCKSGLKLLENNKNGDTNLVAILLKSICALLIKSKNFNVSKKSSILQECFDGIILKMFQNLSNVIQFSRNFKDKIEFTKLLSFITVQFMEKEKINLHHHNSNIIIQISDFPENLKDWPKNTKAFIVICHVLYSYNTQNIWSPKIVINTMTEFIYSRKGESLNYVLKSICFIYPIAADQYFSRDFSRKTVATLGEDILQYVLLHCSSFRDIFTCHWAQFFWIMGSGSKFNRLQKHLLIFWLKNIDHRLIITLAEAVLKCRAYRLIFPIITESEDVQVVERAMALLKCIKNPCIFMDIASTLPLTIENIDIFERLVLSKPEIPEDEATALDILKIVSCAIALFSNQALKSASEYCTQLLAYLKGMVKPLVIFCKDEMIIKYLLKKSYVLEEESAVEIIHLLKTVLTIQVRHKVRIEHATKFRVIPFLACSETKANKILDLLRLINIFGNSELKLLIYVDRTVVHMVFFTILEYSERFNNKTVHLFLASCLHKNPEWANTRSFCRLIEDNSVANTSTPEFLLLLMTWLKISEKKIKSDGISFLPNLQTVTSYILRCRNLSKEKVIICLRRLKEASMYSYRTRKISNW